MTNHSQQVASPALWKLVIFGSIASFCALLPADAVPALAQLFHISSDTAEGVLSWFLFGYGIGPLVYGPLANRFGRKKSSKNNITQNTFGIENTGFEFEIESYLEHLAVKFQNVFDANCYLYLSRSIDWFDIIDYGSSSEEVLGKTGLESALILGVESDVLFLYLIHI